MSPAPQRATPGKRPAWLPMAVLGLVLAAALLYFSLAEGYRSSSYFENVAQLRQIKQLDVQWELDALRSKIGINQSYDPLVSPLPDLNALPDHIAAVAPPGTRAAKALDAGLRGFKAALNDKAGLIESFKSHNAILSNSLVFLPIAAGDFTRVAEQRAASPDVQARMERAAATVRKLLLSTLALEDGSQESQADIELELAILVASGAQLPGQARESLRLFSAHVGTVLREHRIVHGLLEDIAAVPTGRYLDEVNAILNDEQQLQAQRIQQHRLYLLLLSSALAALLLYAAARLIHSHAIINRVNLQLRQANEGLEAAVAERTCELLRANGRLKAEIAERKQLEGRLVQSEKLASIGQLAAGVAHEINNPLCFLASNADMMEQYLERLFEMLAAYQEVEHGAHAARLAGLRARLELDYLRQDIPVMLAESRDGMARVSRIVQSLKDFSRSDMAGEWEWADLHRCIDSTLTIIAGQVRQVADVSKEYGTLPEVQCMPSQLNQVVMNLLVNASHAMGAQRGTIAIRTGADGAEAWIEVADNGCGIAPDVLPRIFDPFYTTKGIGKGTGLGLSLSYGIVQNHRGRIEVQTAPGSGSTFRVTLPLRQAA